MPATKSVTIRRASGSDVPFLLALERRCDSAGHWTEQQYLKMFQYERDGAARAVLIAESTLLEESLEEPSRILGFLVARHLAPEWELENIAVDPIARRKGIGRRLLNALLAEAGETNSHAIFLEVRESNAAARALYERNGFKETGRRRSYYRNPEEDAILYRQPVDKLSSKA
jgi:[ribosomal protein S18]-alanine N-acetyltransferase